ncbi:MAG: DUF2089 domain-containing protein [candidate division Zixibacteria bacterium]|nr:DUF2089 domain-containing protein [candidate division Zixibacteria bacterium]
MSEERRRILAMLGEGKITADEAEELLDAIDEQKKREEPKPKQTDINVGFSNSETDESGTKAKKPKFLRIMVDSKKNGKDEKVNIRIPMMLLRAGVKLTSIVPGKARDKINDKLSAEGIDIDVNNLDSKSLDEIVTGLGSMCIDVDDDDEKVKIFCE